MVELKEMRPGETKTFKATAALDNKVYQTKSGGRIAKNDQVRIVDRKGRETVFYVKRILGKEYLVLSEKRKNKPLGRIESILLGMELGSTKKF